MVDLIKIHFSSNELRAIFVETHTEKYTLVKAEL